MIRSYSAGTATIQSLQAAATVAELLRGRRVSR